MFTSSDYGRMYELLDRPKLKDHDASIAAPCCEGTGIFLFPGEYEYLKERLPEGSAEFTFENELSDPFKIADMQWVFHCSGDDCSPDAQPLGCHLYPTLAYLEEWNYKGITPDREFFYPGPCEACEDPDSFDPDYIRAAFGVWAWLCTDPKVAGILGRISSHARQGGMTGYWTVDEEDNVGWRAIGQG